MNIGAVDAAFCAFRWQVSTPCFASAKARRGLFAVANGAAPQRGTFGPEFDPMSHAGYQTAAIVRCLISIHSASRARHVVQYFRSFIPGHDFWRKPWAGDRLRRRWLSAAHSAHRSRHPALSRSPPAGPIALHHAAPGTRRGENPVRRFRRRRKRRAGDDRYADRAPHRQCRSALEGLFRHQGQIPARPRRLHLRH